VANRVGRAPLSVSTDLIGVVALRAALLLDPYARATKRKPVRRDGLGPVAEVYPAAEGWIHIPKRAAGLAGLAG
jgi:hypothetical protein